MQGLLQAKKLIDNSENILVLANPDLNVDNLSSALSLFNTLNNKGKVVRFYPKRIPNNFKGLFPEKLIPRNVVVSIKNKDVTDIYYTKEGNTFKVYLGSKDQEITDQDVGLTLLQNGESDLLITIGINKLEDLGNFYENNFKLFFQTPLINIDNKVTNTMYGNVNLINQSPISSISEKLIESVDQNIIDIDIKTWLLAGSIEFLNKAVSNEEALKTIVKFTQIGVDYKKIFDYFLQNENKSKFNLLIKVLNNLEYNEEKGILFAKLKVIFEKDLAPVLDILLNRLLNLPNLLVLWEKRDCTISGLIYAKEKSLLDKFDGKRSKNAVLFNSGKKGLNTVEQFIMRKL
jgi:hypothetical protein